MLDFILSAIAPHVCTGCQSYGQVLCDSCRDELTEARIVQCLFCGSETERESLCAACRATECVERAFLFGSRSGALETLIDDYKFARKRAAYRTLADLLTGVLPYRVPTGVVIVPVPTIRQHVRERGYDHIGLISRALTRHYHVPSMPLLHRVSSTVQRGASKRQRHEQAADAYAVYRNLDPSLTYIIIDDVVTTGATLRASTKALFSAGARHIWVAAIARQPLDGQG